MFSHTLVALSRRCSSRTGRLGVALAAVAFPCLLPAQTGYVQTNLISDGSVAAAHTDPNLINPWGLSIGKDLWIDSPGSGLSLVTDAQGAPSFNVAVPAGSTSAPHGSPAGTVFNGDSKSFVLPSGAAAIFLFGTLDGTIAGWNPSAPAAVTVVNNSGNKAAYTDIAIDTNSTGTFLLAANFAAGTVDVFDATFKATHLAGSFADPQMPAGFNPFAVHAIGGNIYVDYAQLNTSNGREVVGAGLGYVDVFDADGNLVQRAISQGVLNAPWGMALAPATFGKFANDLLVGNFGDGTINAFDPKTFSLVGTLSDEAGAPLVNSGLWEIVFGKGSGATTTLQGDPNTLYIAAGINEGKGGLVAALAPSTQTGAGDFSLSAAQSSLTVTAGSSSSVQLSLAGSGNFEGPISLACTGLPAGDTCTFTPASVTLASNATSTVNLTITAAAAGAPPYQTSSLHGHGGMTLAFATPFTLLAFAGMRRRRGAWQGTLLAASLIGAGFTISGCSSSPQQSQIPPPTTQPTTTQITVTATAGTLTHSIPVSLTVQ